MASTKEGFGLAAMEALAAGVPVVARDLPVLREVLGDTVAYAGDVPGIAAALTGVLGTPPDRAPGRAVAAAHTWERAARAHLAYYRRVLGGHLAPHPGRTAGPGAAGDNLAP